MLKASSLSLALCLALLGGCSAPPDTGAVQFAVSVPQALTTVSRVTVTASAADMSPMSVDLILVDGVWLGLLGNLPPGTERTFAAQAFDASGTPRLQGQTSGVTISAHLTTSVFITLQQLSPPVPYENEAPLIDALVASTTTVLEGSTLTLDVTARDPNPGDTLTLAWKATGGSFSAPTAATTTWWAPASSGVQTLTLTVTDSQGASVSASLAINVVAEYATGSTSLHATLNFWPTVSKVSASRHQLDAGQSTTLSALASDVDGDALGYQWTASCPGTWTNPTSSTASFVPSARPTGACNNCRLTVTVSDGRGGQTQGSLALCVASPTAPERFPPVFTHAAQSTFTPAPGQTVSLEVQARDPQASALTFAWSASAGVLGTPVHGATASHVTWTAPACASASEPPGVTVTVTNGFSQTATHGFTVTGLPACTASGWSATGPLALARDGHTAALLLGGKVLVAGGTKDGTVFASAELYEPASGTWSATGAMNASRREGAMVLLPGGKVLVSGGYAPGTLRRGAELYDPASGTWSETGPMSVGRAQHQALVLQDGRVLVVGGGDELRPYSPAAELYDPASGTWSLTGSLAVARMHHTLTLLPGGKVLVTGGSTEGGLTPVAELYDPASGTWSLAASMHEPRRSHTATLLPGGKVLVAGGSVKATAELYDPASDTWSLTGGMTIGRIQHTATLLPGGQVLVAGGNWGPSVYTLAELYDPATQTWSATASMVRPRNKHTAALLPGGQVLVAGGGTSVAELYTP